MNRMRTLDIKIASFDEIAYCKAEGNYTRVFFEDRSILLPRVLSYIESTLPSDQFLRIHKSYLVNRDYIDGIKKGEVLLKKSIALPLARRKRSDILKELAKKHFIIKVVKYR